MRLQIAKDDQVRIAAVCDVFPTFAQCQLMLTFCLKEAMVLDLCKLDVGAVKGSRHKMTVRRAWSTQQVTC